MSAVISLERKVLRIQLRDREVTVPRSALGEFKEAAKAAVNDAVDGMSRSFAVSGSNVYGLISRPHDLSHVITFYFGSAEDSVDVNIPIAQLKEMANAL